VVRCRLMPPRMFGYALDGVQLVEEACKLPASSTQKSTTVTTALTITTPAILPPEGRSTAADLMSCTATRSAFAHGSAPRPTPKRSPSAIASADGSEPLRNARVSAFGCTQAPF